MRELDRILRSPSSARAASAPAAGRRARARPAIAVEGPLGRGADAARADVVLLCVPDGEIAGGRGRRDAPAPLVGHCSGATALDAARRRHEAFSLHPLMTVPDRRRRAVRRRGLRGRRHDAARARPRPRRSPRALGMRAVEVADEDRAAYHAAASIASNFLVTLEGAAERLAATAGVDRELLVPLVRAARRELGRARRRAGAHRPRSPAATRPTVARQRAAIEERAPDLLAAVRRARGRHPRATRWRA